MRENFDLEAALPIVIRQTHPMAYKLVAQTQARRYRYDRAGEGRIWVYRDDPEGEKIASPDIADALALSLHAWRHYFSEGGARGEEETVYHRDSFLGG
jgi:hypothetical protein